MQRYTKGEKSSGKVSLFRNGISTKPICAAQVTKEQFDAYHGPEMSSNRILRRQFHAGYNGNKTDEPYSKRASFLFPAKLGPTSELAENLKADIHYYKALNPDSSCIPFHLNLSSRVRHLTLGIVELDPPADLGGSLSSQRLGCETERLDLGEDDVIITMADEEKFDKKTKKMILACD